MRQLQIKLLAAMTVALGLGVQRSVAQLMLIDESRSISPDSGGTGNPNAPGVYNETGTFSGGGTEEYNDGSFVTYSTFGNAAQDTLISPTDLSGTGSSAASVNIPPTPTDPAAQFAADEVTNTNFKVDFAVLQPTPIVLTESLGGDAFESNFTLTNTTPTGGTSTDFADGSSTFSGLAGSIGPTSALPFHFVLQPGPTYTLTVSTQTAAQGGFNTSVSGSYNFDLTTSVPELSSLPLCASIVGILAIQVRPRRRSL